MIDRLATLRGGFCTQESCGPDQHHAIVIKFRDAASLGLAYRELVDALEREKPHEGALVGDMIPVDQITALEPHRQSGETVPIVAGVASSRIAGEQK